MQAREAQKMSYPTAHPGLEVPSVLSRVQGVVLDMGRTLLYPEVVPLELKKKQE